MSWLIRDFHYGIREGIRRPGFTALAILTLALGIGSVTAMYSVIYNVLLNPFPYTEPRRMVDVIIQDTERSSGGISGALTIPEFRAYVDESQVFEEAVGTDTRRKQRRTEYGQEDIIVGAVTPNVFHFLGVKPLLGRVSTEKMADPVFEIIGVVADIRNRGLEETPLPEVFIRSTVASTIFPTILVRTSADPRSLVSTIRTESRAIDRNTVQPDPAVLDDLIGKFSYSRPRFSVFLMSTFVSIALLRVGTGIYGVMAYAVSQRTREIGIRMALGAEQAQVFRAVLGVAIRLIGLGVAGGTLGSLLTNRLVARQVWTVPSFDPTVLLAGIATIVILGIAACYFPALRATRIQPLIALRHE